MERTRSASAAVVLVVVSGLGAGMLGGCSGGDPQPRIAPSSPVSASASGSPVAAGSTDRAFIDGFFRAIGRSTLSGETSGFVSMTSPSCGNCQTLARNIEGAYANGGHVEGGDWRVVHAEQSTEAGASQGRFWNVEVQTARERWFDGDGNLVKIVRPSTEEFGLILSSKGDATSVRDLRLRS